MLIQNGIPIAEDLAPVIPPADRLEQGPVAIAECFQKIPCNPCTKACIRQAIRIEPDINETPQVDFTRCNGCSACISRCPGLAIFVVDMSYSPEMALVKLPYEFLPVPSAGELVTGLNRSGEAVGRFPVVRVISGGTTNKTYTISLAVPKEFAIEVRNIQVEGLENE